MRMRAKQPMRETGGAPVNRREQRYIYGGERGRSINSYDLPRNRRASRKRASTFNILLVLFAVAIGSVMYINNIIVVNQLAYEVGQLESRYAKLATENAELQAEVNRKSNVDRIGPKAAEQLGMQYPSEHAGSFAIDKGIQEKAAEIDRRWENRNH